MTSGQVAGQAAEGIVVPRLDRVDEEQIQMLLEACEQLLLRSRRIPLLLTRDWTRRFPTDAGVYAVFDQNDLVYVGETGSIAARMLDFLSSRNHVLRRKLGNVLFKDVPGFHEATSSRRFPNNIEQMVTDYIETRLSVSPVIVPFGRAEIEEHMTAKHRPPYNSKLKRGSKPEKGAA
ncbi:MAG: hypothetical protein ABFD92_11960 [Planctomycetaceae bacterium]|nr:hypothetical protein [Planctomycetaceae bacterium]